jgi:hypothetical protein
MLSSFLGRERLYSAPAVLGWLERTSCWKQAFDSDPVGRQQGGVRRYRILRAADDANFVVIELEFDGADEAERFKTRLHDLWSGGASERLGLEGPKATVLETVETVEY